MLQQLFILLLGLLSQFIPLELEDSTLFYSSESVVKAITTEAKKGCTYFDALAKEREKTTAEKRGCARDLVGVRIEGVKGLKFINSWKILDEAGEVGLSGRIDDIVKVDDYLKKNPAKNANDVVSEIKNAPGGFQNWKNTLKGFQEIEWKNGKAIWKKSKLGEHYNKHVIKQKEFGNVTQNEYHELMKDFLGETGDFTQARLGNQLLKYDPITKRVIIGHAKNKEILSFYKALPEFTKIDPWTDIVNEAISKTGLTIKDLKFL